VLIKNGIAISMDGKGAWRDNVFVERLWRSVKYEEVYLKAYDTASEARASIGRYLDFANPHGSLTPADAPLIDAGKLFRQPGPPQWARSRQSRTGAREKERPPSGGLYETQSNVLIRLCAWLFRPRCGQR
jgi:transposase InsO family protein